MITEYSDVASVLGDLRCVPTMIGAAITDLSPEQDRVVCARHTRLKNALGEINIELEQHMPMLLASAAQRLVFAKPFDLVQDLLKPWSLEVAAAALGIAPESHWGTLTDRIFTASAFPYDPESRAQGSSAAVELSACLNTTNPVALQTFIALASSLPCFLANAWALLFSHPDQLQRFQTTPELVPLLIEECLRLAGPPTIEFRKTSCDLEVSGVKIRRNENLLLMLQSANRDPTIFADPETLDIGRINNPHLTFGRGRHSCVGAQIVRSISQRITVRLFSLFKTAELLEPPKWRGFAMRFLDRLPVILE